MASLPHFQHAMRRWHGLAFVAALACWGPAAAEPASVKTPSGTLSLDTPPGYSMLSDAELSAKFGRHGRKPLAAWGNAARTSTVAVTWSRMAQQPLTRERLPQLQSAMEKSLPLLTPGMVLGETGLVDIGPRQWVRIESTAPALDTQIHNLMLLTDLGGHMVGVNYNATAADHAQQEHGFKASAQTLRVQDD